MRAYKDPAFEQQAHESRLELEAQSSVYSLDFEETLTFEVDEQTFAVVATGSMKRHGLRGDREFKELKMEIGILHPKHTDPFKLDHDDFYKCHHMTYSTLEHLVEFEILKRSVTSKDWKAV